MPSWFERDGDTLLIRVHAQPGAKRTEIQGLHGEALKIRVAAPPVEGKANEAIMQFLADTFDVPRRQVELRTGDSSRQKRFAIRGSRINPASLLASPS